MKTKARQLCPPNKLIIILLGLFLIEPAGRGQEKININTASADELRQLPGIGSVIARRIIDYREKNGPFRKPEDLSLIFGIGPKKYSACQDLITVEAGKGEETGGERRSPPAKKSGKININKATQLELEQLPGIGPVKGLRIIEYRESHGGFKRLEELMEVYGIGPKTFASMKERITLYDRFEIPAPPRTETLPSGPITLKCWKCKKNFRIEAAQSRGTCPYCGASWELKQ